jgi:hypothetical protein
MATVTIDYISQLIRESERNHTLQYTEEELLTPTVVIHVAQPWPDQPARSVGSRSWKRRVRNFRDLLDGNLEIPS